MCLTQRGVFAACDGCDGCVRHTRAHTRAHVPADPPRLCACWFTAAMFCRVYNTVGFSCWSLCAEPLHHIIKLKIKTYRLRWSLSSCTHTQPIRIIRAQPMNLSVDRHANVWRSSNVVAHVFVGSSTNERTRCFENDILYAFEYKNKFDQKSDQWWWNSNCETRINFWVTNIYIMLLCNYRDHPFWGSINWSEHSKTHVNVTMMNQSIHKTLMKIIDCIVDVVRSKPCHILNDLSKAPVFWPHQRVRNSKLFTMKTTDIKIDHFDWKKWSCLHS